MSDSYEEVIDFLKGALFSRGRCTVDGCNSFRDAFLDWLDHENSEREIQNVLGLLAELYHKLEGQERVGSFPACSDDEHIWPAEDVFNHYLNVYRHSEAVYDAATALLEQGSHRQAVQ